MSTSTKAKIDVKHILHTTPDILKEILFLFPDAILFGSFLMGLVTVSPQHSALFVSFLESLCILVGIQNVNTFLNGTTTHSNDCTPKTMRYSFQNLFSTASAANSPSYAIYIVAVACSYLGSSAFEFKKELDTFDTSTYKKYISTTMALLAVVFAFAFARIYFSCETVSSVGLGILTGTVVGSMIVRQNVALFGRDTVNIYGIPLIG